MLIGDKQKFAIELELLDVIDGWVFGSFIFWILGLAVGEQNDKTVDLKGCINWLKDFINNPRNRFESGLYELDKEEVYIQLCRSVLACRTTSSIEEKYSDTYSRFHISHIGMSSFDDVNILLVENETGLARCVWKQNDQEIEEAFLSSDEMNQVAAEVIAFFDHAISTA